MPSLQSLTFKEIPVDFSPAYVDLLCLRQAVLRTPLGLTFTLETLQGEADQTHIGLYQAGIPHAVGCCLIKQSPDGWFQMRQVAVHPAFQGRCLGQQLVAYFEAVVAKRRGTQCCIFGRTNVLPFYQKMGYHIVGDPFPLLETQLDHYRMEKQLA